MPAPTLLNPQDSDPVRRIPAQAGGWPFVLVGDHAGSAIPQALGDLGLAAADRARHIAIDIGTQALGEELARRLGAPFVSQTYSRLVIDCNRDPGHAGSIVEESDGTRVPANIGLTSREREARRAEILEPYQQAIASELDGVPDAVLISLHSFTPELAGVVRPWEVGVLHGGGRGDFALRLLEVLQGDRALTIGDNEPYQMDSTDYTVPRHAFARDLRYAEIEVRQDLLADPQGIARQADRLSRALVAALGRD